MRIAVTGATGFVGRRLVARLCSDGHTVVGIVRGEMTAPSACVEVARVGPIDGATDWGDVLIGADCVIHLAARTHAVGERGGGDLRDYRPLNVDGTRALAEAAVGAGVSRFVFLSSIKVNGERTTNRPFSSTDPAAPVDAYGISKWEAEKAVTDVGRRGGLDVVVVRPPLVYGEGAKGNIARLRRALTRRGIIPVPLVDNRRSLVALDNLVDLLVRCATHPAAPGNTFLVSDGEDLSTAQLIRRFARELNSRAWLVPVPASALRLGGRLTGRTAVVERFLGSLQVEMEHTCRTLGWSPPLSVNEGLKRTAKGD